MSEFGASVEGFKYLKCRNGIYYIWFNAKKKWSLGTRDLAEAQRLYVEQIGDDLPENRAIRCSEAFDIYIAHARVEPATRQRYRSLWNLYAFGFLGTKRVAEVEPRDIIRVLGAATVSVKTGRPLSAQSRRHIYVMLSAFFRSCTEEPTRYRPDNPVASIGRRYRPETPVSGAVAEEVVISEAEVDEIAAWIVNKANHGRQDEHVTAHAHATIVQLMPWIGARLGEMLALQLTDWNRFARPYEEITIERQVDKFAVVGDEATWTKQLKGKAGTVGDEVRVIPLAPKAVAILEAYVALGTREGWLKPGGLLFPTVNGTPRSVTHVTTAITTAATAILGRRYTSHSFRHTFASRILEAGGTLAEISELLGNSIEVCRKRYAHRVNRAAFNTRLVALLEAGAAR